MPPTDGLLPPGDDPINSPAERAIRRRIMQSTRVFYSEAAALRAAELLREMWAVGVRHGVHVDEWAGVSDLADACLSVARYRSSIPVDGKAARTKLDQLYSRLASLGEVGQELQRDGDLQVSLALSDPWPYGHRLAVSIDPATGWQVYTCSRVSTRVSPLTIVAPFDDDARDVCNVLLTLRLENAERLRRT